MSQTTFALVDCNNFYASCERLFRPDLKDKPIVVLSNNDGCVISRSKEAKALGIRMGIPFFQIAPLIKRYDITLFSSNYALYADMSQRVMQTLGNLSPRIEVYSIDEAFLDLSGTHSLFDMQILGETIQSKILKDIGLSVGVGIAPTKTLAKLANYGAKHYPKTGGVVDLSLKRRQHNLMKITPVSEVWGVGRQLSKKLAFMNIKTAWDLACSNPAEIRRLFSVVLERTVRELNGENCLSLEEIAPAKKQIISSRSFGERITNIESMREAISSYASRASEKLRAENQLSKFMNIFITTSQFNPNTPYYAKSQSVQFITPTDDTRIILTAANQALERIWKDGFAYAKAGIMLADFSYKHQQQLDFFHNNPNSDKLMKTIDTINQKSRHTLFFASQGIEQHWGMKRDYLSPAYTTNWKDLMSVK
ncbi:translesion error-prone DNA polymerase V subunit UmuC [Thorsellia anophelis]|uniref:DNA polymerase V n=1 Tax=Thorsellia anophelis DSM 18579 TaxID=1123402 RepID=A0A1I0F890_9GAMM|nr:translesion error-prone DNA polymerase V subunit UmuC [Thorsellia anophelis]SET53328.1 DNA polymerase V [Thorsellia anophelis DSM 18579]